MVMPEGEVKHHFDKLLQKQGCVQGVISHFTDDTASIPLHNNSLPKSTRY